MDEIQAGTSRCFVLPVKETQYFRKGNAPDSLCLKKASYEYVFSHIGNFDSFSNKDACPGVAPNISIYSAYDWAITKKTIKNYRPDLSIADANLLSKTEINYLNLKLLYNQLTYRTASTFDKQASDYLTTRSLHFGTFQAINVINNASITKSINVPPILGLETEIINYNNSGSLVNAKKNVYNETYFAGPSSPEYRRGAIKEVYAKGKTGNYILTKTYNYHGGWERNMIEKETNIFGAVARTYYKYVDMPEYGTATSVSGKRMQNNQDFDLAYFIQNYYQFEAPMASEAYIRKYESVNNNIVLVTDTLRNIFEKNYFGQITGSIDPNGWYSQSIYDNIGRKLIDRLPYDFPSPAGISQFSKPISDCVPITKSMLQISNTLITTSKSLGSGQNVTKQIKTPNLSFEINKDLEFGKKLEFISQTQNADSIKQQFKITEKTVKLVYEPSSYDAFHRSNSTITGLKLKLLLEEYPNNCTSFNVKIANLNFETNFIVGCAPLSNLNNSCDNTPSEYKSPEVNIDLNSVRGAFVNLPLNQTLEITFTVNTTDGYLRIPDLGNPFSPCLETQSIIQTTTEDDYTRKFVYDDKNLTQSNLAKVDDYVINQYDYTTKKMPNSYSKSWLRTFIGTAGRYTGMNQEYGVMSNLMKQKNLIGTPLAPSRIDSVGIDYSGLITTDPILNTKETILDEFGRVFKIKNEDGTFKQFAYRIGTRQAILPNSTDDYFGICMETIETNERNVRSAKYTDGWGNVRMKIVDLDGVQIITKYVYDELGRLIQEINPKSQSILYTYDDYGRVKTKQQTDLGTIKYAYDKAGQLRFSQNDEQSANSKFSYFEYDDLGRSTIVGEAKINSVNFNSLTPDVLNFPGSPVYTVYTSNPTIWQKNGGTVNKILSDTVNLSYFLYNKVRTNHNLTNFGYMKEFTDTLTGSFFMHDAKYYSDLTYPSATYNTFEDISAYPQFVKVAVCYDKLPQKIGNIWENMPTIEAVNKLAPKDALKNLKGQKAAIAYRDNEDDPFHYVFFSYDARGRIEAIIRWTENIGFDVVRYTYNSMNKINSVTAVDALRQFTTWNVYDDNGRLWKVYSKLGSTTTGFGHSVDTVNYALVDFPEPLVMPDFPDITYSYNSRGGVETVNYTNSSVVKSIIYNPRGWVDQIIARKGTNDILFTQVLERDAMGNITKQTSNHRYTNPKVNKYTYDNLNRLTEWKYNNDVSFEDYEYDRVGNRTSVNRNSLTDTYNYTGGNNKLYSVNLANNRVRNLIYNNYGAVTEINEKYNGTALKQEFWEYVNSTIPKRYRLQNKTNEYLYIAYAPANDKYNFAEWDWSYRRGAFDSREQKRLMKSPHGDGKPNDSNYVHLWEYSLTGAGGEELILYKGIQTVVNVKPLGPNDPKTDIGRRVYISPFKYYSAGGELQFQADGTKEIHITDNLGSVRCIIIGDGTNIKSFDYKPFGELEYSSDGKTTRKGYATSELDGESSYFSMGVRMYSAEMGRFLAVDPMFELMPRFTPYHYSFNSPLNYCDPNGI